MIYFYKKNQLKNLILNTIKSSVEGLYNLIFPIDFDDSETVDETFKNKLIAVLLVLFLFFFVSIMFSLFA